MSSARARVFGFKSYGGHAGGTFDLNEVPLAHQKDVSKQPLRAGCSKEIQILIS